MSTDYKRDRVERNQMLMPWLPAETISSGDAAAMMQCSTEVVRSLLEEGKIKGYRLTDAEKSPWRVYRNSVELYIDRLRKKHAV